jgi:hypothetical protein
VHKDLILALDLYCNMTTKLPLYDMTVEVENVLMWRDEIHDELLSGGQLSPEQQQRLKEADDRLLAQRDRLVRDFPRAFERTEEIGPQQWWWHLDKGPQVRAEAEQAA